MRKNIYTKIRCLENATVDGWNLPVSDDHHFIHLNDFLIEEVDVL